MEKQKNKPKNTPNRLNRALILKVLLFFIVSLIAVVALLIIYAPTGEIHQTSLPEELRPTAEYVFDVVSFDERVVITDDISLDVAYFPPNSGVFNNNYHVICVSDVSSLSLSKYEINSKLFINGRRVYGNAVYGYIGGLGSISISKCVEGNLEPGLHLIEFHLRDSRFGAPIAIQQWAIEID